ncbi:MAG: sugar transporter [Bacteroidaceae bacterium]|nr:sugar transporter [Bacteroidaceae bacterium]
MSQPTESRVKKTLLNARVNMIFYFLILILSFFSRKIFLECLGVDFVGLIGTLNNLLGFLNLAELGIGSAIGYVLYKPIFDDDRKKINEIISVMGYLYRVIGNIILVLGLILACFLPFIFPNTGFHLGVIYFTYFSFLFSSLIGYYINYRQNLLGADQRNYIITGYFQTSNLVKTLIQLALAYYTGSYILWVIIEFSFAVIFACILNWKINQVYPWLESDVKEGKLLFKKYSDVITYTRQLFVHRISAFVQFQIAPFLIYAFVSLQTVALYGNYTMLFDKISQIFNNLFGSASASIANLIAEGNKEKILRVFWVITSIRFYIATVVICCFYLLIEPFISIWLGVEFILPKQILYLLLVNFFVGISRGTDSFLYGYGLFADTWAPIVESTIYILVAIIGGNLFGLTGIVLATTISTILIIGIWKPYYLFSRGFKLSVFSYWKRYVIYIFVLATNIFVIDVNTQNINIINVTIFVFLYRALFTSFIIAILNFVVFYLIFKEFRSAFRYYVLKQKT